MRSLATVDDKFLGQLSSGLYGMLARNFSLGLGLPPYINVTHLVERRQSVETVYAKVCEIVKQAPLFITDYCLYESLTTRATYYPHKRAANTYFCAEAPGPQEIFRLH
ncbi:hypothetical protein TNCV_3320391 [Trichonephila clavipes]|nr:hypothetical protein TNCV_3320391 [Trichonephila clavipes]